MDHINKTPVVTKVETVNMTLEGDTLVVRVKATRIFYKGQKPGYSYRVFKPGLGGLGYEDLDPKELMAFMADNNLVNIYPKKTTRAKL